ncbi:MAG: glycogen/starch synthase, partial [Simkaniaceae bacterium]|nr:glycogen/starch synthase [Simkaniaceae bacterium]
IIPLIIKKQYHQLNTRITGSLLTIHNLQFQGHCSWHHLNAIGFDPTPDMNMNDPRDNHRYNLLKSGILYADDFTTVSPTYAKEIQTHDHGWWLQDIIKEHSYKLSGILNGIDVDLWNPSTDTALERNYSAQAPIIEVMQAKHHNKRHLQQQVGLPHSNRPLIISITRLASQKAPHLILQAMKKAISFDMQYLLIGGITSEPFTHLFDEVKHHPNIHIEYGFNDELARLSYAGADAIMIPSYFEPCGLTQLIGMRYGTIPIVRRTGGLNDTVIDNETGFIFNDPNEFAIDYIMTRVDACFGKTPEHWQKMMYRGMHIDVSWEKPAREYLELYQKIAH